MRKKRLHGKRMQVAEGLRLRVSRHFYYSTFGVFGRHDKAAQLHEYICDGQPGTGFIVRRTDSHSYQRFVSKCRKKLKQNPWTLLFQKEPNFKKEGLRVENALTACTDKEKERILSSYLHVIGLAKEEELLQRVVRAIKNQIERKPSKSLVSVMMHYKSSIAGLEHDVSAVQLDYTVSMNDAQKEAWNQVVMAFQRLVDARRVWSVYIEDGEQSYQQVFFDMGVFDYVKSPGFTPLMRDYKDTHYYLYPAGMVVARSSVDFDFYSWKDMEIQAGDVDISTLAVRPQFYGHQKRKRHHRNFTDALSTLYGASRSQVLGELYLPKLEARFFTNHIEPAQDFVNALESYKKVNG